MPKKYKSKAMEALHEAMGDLHRAGAIDDAKMRKYDRACLAAEAEESAVTGPRYYVFKDANGKWRWRLITSNGKAMAESVEGYKTRAGCLAVIELVKKSAKAPVAA